jgi:hypothetical protein
VRRIVMALGLSCGLLAGCARVTSTPDASASQRNAAGYGLHVGLGGYVSDSGVWNLPAAGKDESDALY